MVGDDEVEYDSDASSNAIEEDAAARGGGLMPNNVVTPSPDALADRRKNNNRRLPKSTLKTDTRGRKTPGGGKTPGRGVTFQSPGQHDVVNISDDDEGEGSAGSSPEPEEIALPTGAQDPYGLDELRTPTPPPPMKPFSSVATPGGGGGGMPPKTPTSTIGRKTGGYGGYGEPPPTHSKALAAALASAAKPGKSLNFARHKETIARALYDEFNTDAFDARLPAKLEITWNAKLLTTAGLTHYKKITRSSGVSEYHARIELSTKVLDTAEKLEATLLHEMCHAAAWLLDHCAKPPHGGAVHV